MAERTIKIEGSIKNPIKPMTKKQFEALQKKGRRSANTKKK